MRLLDRLAQALWRDVDDRDEIGQPIRVGTSLWSRTARARAAAARLLASPVLIAVLGGVAGSVATVAATRFLEQHSDVERDTRHDLQPVAGKATLKCKPDRGSLLLCEVVRDAQHDAVAVPKSPGGGTDHPNLKAAPK